MSNYARGRAKEYAAIEILRALGFNARRSAGSHSPVDVTADRAGETIYIQVKYNCGIAPGELKAFKAYATAPGIKKQVWLFKRGVKLPKVVDCE